MTRGNHVVLYRAAVLPTPAFYHLGQELLRLQGRAYLPRETGHDHLAPAPVSLMAGCSPQPPAGPGAPSEPPFFTGPRMAGVHARAVPSSWLSVQRAAVLTGAPLATTSVATTATAATHLTQRAWDSVRATLGARGRLSAGSSATNTALATGPPPPNAPVAGTAATLAAPPPPHAHPHSPAAGAVSSESTDGASSAAARRTGGALATSGGERQSRSVPGTAPTAVQEAVCVPQTI